MAEEVQLTDEQSQAVITEEEIVRTVTESLREQRTNKIRRVSVESERARDLTARIVNASSDVDKQLLASDEAVAHALSRQGLDDLDSLDKQILSPYFARFITEEEENGRSITREYRLGTAGNPDTRIVDWRKAPISKLYYEYKEGEEFSEEIQGQERNGTIALRNAVQIRQSELHRLQCRTGAFVKQNGIWKAAGGGSLRSGSGMSYGQLPSILSLITADQFKTITEDAQSAILIQGIAGSGKTTVALHRLAWLLHEDNSDLKKEDALILVLAPALKAYIDHSLSGLELDGVSLRTFREWANQIFNVILPDYFNEHGELQVASSPCPRSIMRVKRSLALLRCVEEEEELYRAAVCNKLQSFSDSDTERAAIKKAFAGNPLIPALREVTTLVKRSGGKLLNESENLLKQARQLPQRIAELLEDTDNVVKYDATGFLQARVVRDSFERTRDNLNQGVLDTCDSSILLRLIQIRYGDLPRKDGSYRKYSHIVVDEIQDYGPVELAVVINAVSHTHQLTLVGDTAQMLTTDVAFPGWERLRQYWDFPEDSSRYVSLRISYRSTLPIMKLADHVQKRSSVESGRQGKRPIWFHSRIEDRAFQAAIKWLETACERFPEVLTAVLCSNLKEAKHVESLLSPTFGSAVRLGTPESFSFEEGILVTDVATIKGLEFYNVLIWNVSRERYPDTPVMRNKLYVAMTRAEENLAVISWGRHSPLLPDPFSKLVRYVGLDIDDREVERGHASS